MRGMRNFRLVKHSKSLREAPLDCLGERKSFMSLPTSLLGGRQRSRREKSESESASSRNCYSTMMEKFYAFWFLWSDEVRSESSE